MAQVIQLAKLFGWKTYHTFDSRRSAAGFPDILMTRGRRLLLAELKSSTGRVKPAQREWLDALRETGVEVHEWRPADFPTIQEVLKR